MVAAGGMLSGVFAACTSSEPAGTLSTTVFSKGVGGDSYWKGWPEELGAAPVAARAGADEESGEAPVALGLPIAVAPPTKSSSRGGASDRVRGTLYVRIDEGSACAVVELVVESGSHIYHGPTRAELGHPDAIGDPTTVSIEGGGVEWGAAHYPEPEPIDQDIGDEIRDRWINTHHGTVHLLVEGLVTGEPDPEDVFASIAGQVCDDQGCLPFEFELESAGAGNDALFAGFEALSAAAVSAGRAQGPGSGGSSSLGAFLLQAVFWGIITLLMPCTYPMIPITISFFTKQAIARDGKVLHLSLTYGAGIVAIFILIGLLAAPVIIPFATHPITNLVIGGLFLFFAFVLFGWVDLQPPQALMNVAGKASARGGIFGVFLMGATLVVTSFTCTAPFVGILLGSAATTSSGGMTAQEVLRVVLGMGVFGLTMATPFVLLSMVPGKIQQLPKAGEWMNTIKVFLGFVELAAALKFISNADIVWRWKLLSREVFLIAWIAIFAGAGIFLLRKALETRRQTGRYPKIQMSAAGLTALLVTYLFWGLPGRIMDVIMTAILPNYSHTAIVEALGGQVTRDRHVIIKDDFDEATRVALAQNKLLLVNFTGFT